jgi:hypothetical protein
LEPLKLWRAIPAKPLALPWLAVWLTPHIAFLPAETAERVMPVFGDLERCVAWGLIP